MRSLTYIYFRLLKQEKHNTIIKLQKNIPTSNRDFFLTLVTITKTFCNLSAAKAKPCMERRVNII